MTEMPARSWCCGCRDTVAGTATSRKRSAGTVVKMTGIADLRVAAGVLYRIFAARQRHGMASLTYSCALIISVFALAACVSEEYLAGLSGGSVNHVSANQEDVGALAGCGIVRVVLHMGSVAVYALYVLPQQVMAFLAGMTVGADIRLVRLAAGRCGATPVTAQQETVAAA